jgi:hypothetical protein
MTNPTPAPYGATPPLTKGEPHAVAINPKDTTDPRHSRDSSDPQDTRLGRPKRYRNPDTGQIVYKDRQSGEEVVVTPLHDVDDEVTVTGKIIAVGDGSDGNEYVDVAVKALTHSTVPTLQYQTVRMDSENAVIVVPGSQVREREAQEAKELKQRVRVERESQAREAAELALREAAEEAGLPGVPGHTPSVTTPPTNPPVAPKRY